MKKEYIARILLMASLGFGIAPAFALTLDKPPMPKSNGSAKAVEKTAPSQTEAVNPLYPAKYTPEYIKGIKDEYKAVGKDEVFYVALDMLKGTGGEFSRNAVLGNNLTSKPIKVEFKDLGSINKSYATFDALGWKRGSKLYIYISQKHNTSPAIAIAALLSHEALHQDEFNSLSEETYAWTMEAAVWCELLELYPDYQLNLDSLVQRENTLKKIFERGNYSDKYIKKTVYSNEGYQNLPESSPGFEAL
ncbi:MAG: hypothetical protein WCY19_02415 [Candidatus Gastranaerophilaceae bacterium]